MYSVKNDTQGTQLYEQLPKLWEEAGMRTHKWLSNSEVVLNRITPSDRMHEVNLDRDPLPSAKTLGVMWYASEDVFTFVSHITEQECEWTKRIFLSRIATLFDPLGLMVPFLIRAKILMQEVWLHGLEWDEKLPQELFAKVNAWFAELSLLSEMKISRCLQLKKVPGYTHLSTSLLCFNFTYYAMLQCKTIWPIMLIIMLKTFPQFPCFVNTFSLSNG